MYVRIIFISLEKSKNIEGQNSRKYIFFSTFFLLENPEDQNSVVTRKTQQMHKGIIYVKERQHVVTIYNKLICMLS